MDFTTAFAQAFPRLFCKGKHLDAQLQRSQRVCADDISHRRRAQCSASTPGTARVSNMREFERYETVLFDQSAGRREWNSSATLHIVYAYPNEYAVGICSLGYQIVWRTLCEQEGVCVSRLFTDAMEPFPESTDVIGFSISWELDYKGLFDQLEFLGLPRRACDRDESAPLVFGGGPVLTANPEPFADFFDVVLLGDGEDVLPQFSSVLQQTRGQPKAQVLRALACLAGVYVPSLYTVRYESPTGPIKSIDPIDSEVPPYVEKATYRGRSLATSSVVTPKMAWENIFMVEAVRSCPEMCTFCLASFVTLPFRSAPVEESLIPAIDRGLTATSRIGILGASVTQHPEFDALMDALQHERYDDVRLSLSSVRANTLTESLARTLVRHGTKSATIAIESGSPRLREIVNKKLATHEIHEAVLKAQAGGLSGLKLYGMAGIPGEISQDHDETLELFTHLQKQIRTRRSSCDEKDLHLTFGCSTFVPKAHTPFQWFGVRRTADKTIKTLEKRLPKLGVDFRPESYKWSCIQALLSRGDRRISKVLESVTAYGDSLGSFRRAFKDHRRQLPDLEYFVYEDWPIDAVLPWDHLRTAVNRDIISNRRVAAEELFAARSGGDM